MDKLTTLASPTPAPVAAPAAAEPQVVTNRGEVSHFNVKMDKDIQYDVYVPEKNVKIEIRPNDENAKILSVRRVVAPNDDAEYTPLKYQS